MNIATNLKTKILERLGAEVLESLLALEYEGGDYLDVGVTDSSRVSYIPKNALGKYLELNEDERLEYRRSKGVFVKLSKLLTLCGYDNPTVSRLAAKFAANDEELSVVEGSPSEIYELCYDYRTLYGCMNRHYEELDSFYSFFDVKALLFKRRGQIIGRALLWKEVELEGYGVYTFLDRVYTNHTNNGGDYEHAPHDQEALESILAYAKRQGWVTKAEQSYSSKELFILPDGRQVTATAIVNAKEYIDVDGFVPYIDTFTYLHVEDGYISNDSSGAEYKATRTDGEAEFIGYTCYYCGEYIHDIDEAHLINDNYYCSEECANRDGYYLYEVITRDGSLVEEWLDEEDSNDYVYLENYSAYAHIEDTVYCEHCDEYVLAVDSKEIEVAFEEDGSVSIESMTICYRCVDDFVQDVTLIVNGEVYENVWIPDGHFEEYEYYEELEFEGVTYQYVYLKNTEVNGIEEVA